MSANKKTALYIAIAAILSACGGGGDSKQSSSSVETKIGTFTDSPVAGLWYKTASNSGFTNSLGQYSYKEGETVEFFIGDTSLGAVKASGILSPVDLTNGSPTDEKTLNILRLLQSLDVDRNPSNGIIISNESHEAAKSRVVSLEGTSSEASLLAFVNNARKDNLPLIDKETALKHFLNTLSSQAISYCAVANDYKDIYGTEMNSCLGRYHRDFAEKYLFPTLDAGIKIRAELLSKTVDRSVTQAEMLEDATKVTESAVRLGFNLVKGVDYYTATTDELKEQGKDLAKEGIKVMAKNIGAGEGFVKFGEEVYDGVEAIENASKCIIPVLNKEPIEQKQACTDVFVHVTAKSSEILITNMGAWFLNDRLENLRELHIAREVIKQYLSTGADVFEDVGYLGGSFGLSGKDRSNWDKIIAKIAKTVQECPAPCTDGVFSEHYETDDVKKIVFDNLQLLAQIKVKDMRTMSSPVLQLPVYSNVSNTVFLQWSGVSENALYNLKWYVETPNKEPDWKTVPFIQDTNYTLNVSGKPAGIYHFKVSALGNGGVLSSDSKEFTVNVDQSGVPVVLATDYSPKKAKIGQLTEFTVLGENFYEGLAYTVEGCTNPTVPTITDTKFIFSCTPTLVGDKHLIIKDKPDGTELFNQVVAVSEVVTTPTCANAVSSVICEDFNGSVAKGTANGVTFINSPNGQAASFNRASESRIQYPFSGGLPKEGTLEFIAKIDAMYRYENYVMKTNEACALLFTTDIQGGDVTWPGSAWLYVCNNGDVSFHIAGEKYEPGHQAKYRMEAKATSFRFGEWHRVGVSYGSQGRYISVNGQIVASSTTQTQQLGAGGTHSSPIDTPTIGEPVPGFWKNNQWEGGFEGAIDAFRASATQKDWHLSK